MADIFMTARNSLSYHSDQHTFKVTNIFVVDYWLEVNLVRLCSFKQKCCLQKWYDFTKLFFNAMKVVIIQHILVVSSVIAIIQCKSTHFQKVLLENYASRLQEIVYPLYYCICKQFRYKIRIGD